VTRRIAWGTLVMLDTGVLVHLAREGDAIGEWVESTYHLSGRGEKVLLATAVEAEIMAIARYGNWGHRRLRELNRMLEELVRVEMDRPAVIEAYAMLYCVARREGQAIHDPNQNDLWIAATAHATGAVLLTQDGDFGFLHPKYIQVECIPTRLP